MRMGHEPREGGNRLMSDQRHPLTGQFLKSRMRDAMTPRQQDAVEGLFQESERFSDSHTILRRGQLANRSTMLVEGFMVRSIEERGKRHVVGIHVPGDFVDLHAYALKRLDHDMVTVGSTRVAYAEHEAIERVVRDDPDLTRILWFATLLDGAIQREWIMKMEQLPADGRLAHLIAEIWTRLEMVGLSDQHGFGFPLTQADLADACGTTAIHMNRIVRKLRTANICDIRRGRVSVDDRARLEEAASFNGDYLFGHGALAEVADLDLARPARA
jgi:CRP-like cAMP-binding protein